MVCVHIYTRHYTQIGKFKNWESIELSFYLVHLCLISMIVCIYSEYKIIRMAIHFKSQSLAQLENMKKSAQQLDTSETMT